MPTQRPIPLSDQTDSPIEVYTFGPYAAANFAAANTHLQLPIEFAKDTVIHDVRFKVSGTIPSTADCKFALTKGSVDAATKVVTAPSGALTSTTSSTIGNQVCTARVITSGNINGQSPNQSQYNNFSGVLRRLEWAPVQKGFGETAAATFNTQVQPGDPILTSSTSALWENVIEKCNNLYVYSSAIATALAGLYVTIRVSERRIDGTSSWR
jgi:hypothetical protein